MVDSDSEDGTYGGIFTSVNQNRVTRSGRRIVAPKHFMYIYVIFQTPIQWVYVMILGKLLYFLQKQEDPGKTAER